MKKFWLTKFKAVSFGSYEIPVNKRLGFNINDINQIDSESSSDDCDSDDSYNTNSSNTSNETVSNTTTSNHNVYDLFQNRKKKYSNLFITSSNINVNNISLSDH